MFPRSHGAPSFALASLRDHLRVGVPSGCRTSGAVAGLPEFDCQPHRQSGIRRECDSHVAGEVLSLLLESVVLGQLVGLPDLGYTFGACLFSGRFEGFVPN